MAENLTALILGIIDHLDAMETEQEFLELCQRELNQPDEKNQTRLRLLLNSYQSQTEYHFSELHPLVAKLKPKILELKELIGGGMAQNDG